MKLEITDVMIFEWDAETMCMIVSPAEGWKVNVNYPISEAHASMVTMEKMDPDYSGLVGKWVRCHNTEDRGTYWLTVGKWYPVVGIDKKDGTPCIGDKECSTLSFGWVDPEEVFDLTDARDYNPDERKPHQLQEYDAVECTPEERAEIIRIADECGVPVYIATKSNQKDMPYLVFQRGKICGVPQVRDNNMYKLSVLSAPDFIAKIRGQYNEEKKIPFDLERWRSGDFVRVETVEGNQVNQLVALELKDSHAMAGVVCGCFASWTEAGIFVSVMETDKDDLTLIVKESTEHKHESV